MVRSFLGLFALLAFPAWGVPDCWNHVFVNGGQVPKIELSYQTDRRGHFNVAPELWIKVEAPFLTSDSIVDAELWIAEVDALAFRPFKKVELLFNKRQEHFTWKVENLVIWEEGTTGGIISPRYQISLSVKGADGVERRIMNPAPIIFSGQ